MMTKKEMDALLDHNWQAFCDLVYEARHDIEYPPQLIEQLKQLTMEFYFSLVEDFKELHPRRPLE